MLCSQCVQYVVFSVCTVRCVLKQCAQYVVFSNSGRQGQRSRYSTSLRLDGTGIEFRWGRHFRVRPDRPGGPISLLCNTSFREVERGVKRKGCGANHPHPYSAKVANGLEPYLLLPPVHVTFTRTHYALLSRYKLQHGDRANCYIVLS